jgi:two-component system LytT family sensor kinase
VVTKPNEARKMIQQLSDFLRGTLKKEEVKSISLNDEIEHLKLYLAIEKVRFGHRLNVEVNLKDNTLNAYLPPLLLQPLVENAIKFGLYDTLDEDTIKLISKTENNYLIIQISNPFDFNTQQANEGTGLVSVKRRLMLIYGRNDLFITEKENNCFKATLRIPQK